VVTEYLDYLWELGELPVYILVVLALHGSQVAMVWPLPVPGDLQRGLWPLPNQDGGPVVIEEDKDMN
jgi:hypothetical protein